MQCILDELKTIYEPENRPKLSTGADVYEQMKDIKDASKEMFVAFYLDTKNKVLAREVISIGILNANLIHPRETFRGAILHNAHAIIVSHNHPSGDPTPSQADIDVTNMLKNAGELLGIEVLDHIIAGRNNFISLKESGVMH
jgi:DNA repair protein RadC